ncbi:MAG: tectonin domain-containing protein [bacterium]
MNLKLKISIIITALGLTANYNLHTQAPQQTQPNIWAIMQDGRVCCREGIDAHNPTGKTWKKTDGFGQELVVNRFGHVWKLDPKNNNIQVRTGISLTNAAGDSWTPVDGKAIHLAMYGDDILAIQASAIYKRTGITATKPEGEAWQLFMDTKNVRKLAGNTDVQLPVGLTETIAAIDSKGTIYFQSGITEENLQGGTFLEAKSNHFFNEISGKIVSLAVNDYGTVWAINEAGQINYKKDLHADWQPVKGALKQLDIDNNGNVWGISEMGINATGGLNYHPTNKNGWQPLGDGFAYVTVNKITGNAIAVKTDGTMVYCTEPTTAALKFAELPSPRRAGKPVAITMAAINKDNYLWVLDAENNIWFTTLNPLKLTATTWLQIPGKLRYISITNRGQVRGIDSENKAYFRTQVDPLNIHGVAWEELKTPAGSLFDMIFSSGIELGEIKQDPATTKKAIEKQKGLGKDTKKLDNKAKAKKATIAKSPKGRGRSKKNQTKKTIKQKAKKQKAKKQKTKPVKRTKETEALASASATPAAIEIEKVTTSDVARELSIPQEKTHVVKSDNQTKKTA